MKFVCAAVLLWNLTGLAAVGASEQLQFVEEWMLWKAEHSKSYSGGKQEAQRHSAWLANRDFVLSHNSNWQEHGYSLALNQFADLVSTLPTYACYRAASNTQ